jgi:nitrogen fixation/metabolism regulation signal transduction histidine kinase
MKKKALKKITLHRETLRHLDGGLEAVVGGVTVGVICATKNPTVCNVNSGCASCLDCGIETHTCPP